MCIRDSGYSALVSKGMTKSEENLIRSIPEALSVTERICLSLIHIFMAILGGAKAVYGQVLSESAEKILQIYGIEYAYEEKVPYIENLSLIHIIRCRLSIYRGNSRMHSSCLRCSRWTSL